MRTHKNTEQIDSYYIGSEVAKPTEIYQFGNKWYLAVDQYKMRWHYPWIKDTVFMDEEHPHLYKLGPSEGTVFHPISYGTATVLLRKNGYASLSTLAKEIQDNPSPYLSSLPGATAHKVLAHIDTDKQLPYASSQRVPAKPSFGIRALAMLQFVVVDIPGTLVYNISMPVAAPFVFFKRLNEINQKNPLEQ